MENASPVAPEAATVVPVTPPEASSSVPVSSPEGSSSPSRIPSARRKGMALLLLPYVLLALSYLVFLGATVFLVLSGQEPEEVIDAMISYAPVLLFLFLLFFFVIPPLFIYGLTLMLRRQPDPTGAYDDRSGEEERSVVPVEITGWNWGAAGLPFIWGSYHRVWLDLLVFVPGVNLVWWIVAGVKGSGWAWRKSKWKSVEEFQEMQSKWKPWGILFVILRVMGFTVGLIGVVTMVSLIAVSM